MGHQNYRGPTKRPSAHKAKSKTSERSNFVSEDKRNKDTQKVEQIISNRPRKPYRSRKIGLLL